jgi:hypothetical protein
MAAFCGGLIVAGSPTPLSPPPLPRQWSVGGRPLYGYQPLMVRRLLWISCVGRGGVLFPRGCVALGCVALGCVARNDRYWHRCNSFSAAATVVWAAQKLAHAVKETLQ